MADDVKGVRCCTRVGAMIHIVMTGDADTPCHLCGRTARETADDPTVPATNAEAT